MIGTTACFYLTRRFEAIALSLSISNLGLSYDADGKGATGYGAEKTAEATGAGKADYANPEP